MYHTHVGGGEDAAFARLDEALIRLRRLWHIPAGSRRGPDAAAPPELSTVLVVDAISRQQRSTTPVRIADIAARLDVTPSTASRLVDRATRTGVVVRESDRHDPRRAALRLTPAGTALLDDALAFRMHYLKRILGEWSGEDIHSLAVLLSRFADEVHLHGLPNDRRP